MSQRSRTTESSSALRQRETVFGRYSTELYRYVLHRLKRPADAADLTQEIFERFLRGDGSGKASNPQAYLFGIAAHVVADAHLAAGRDVVVYDSQAYESLAETVPDSRADPAERMGLELELKAALEQLPSMHRAVFLLAKWEGLSIQEIAARLKLTEGSVTVYVCEARAKLKTLLKHRQGR